MALHRQPPRRRGGYLLMQPALTQNLAKTIFWASSLLIVYTYLGYALLLKLLRPHPIHPQPITPTISIILAAHNEEANLPAKLDNLRRLAYPQDRIQIVVASDGSTDRTVAILHQHPTPITPVILPQPQGKASALNHAVRQATGEILVFFDVRQSIDLNALVELASCFADPQIGAVSGELLLETVTGEPSPDALGIYWKLEKLVRKLESSSGSVVGATGAIYAIRRDLYAEIPHGTLLDDVFIPMHVVRAGKRVVFQPTAIARDRVFEKKGKEFSRKVRTLTGNYQLIQAAPWMLSFANPILFRFISHKLLRLAVPLLLVSTLLSSLLVHEPFYRIVLAAQAAFYALAALGAAVLSTRRVKLVSIAYTFVMLNVAAARAFYNTVTGRKDVWS